MEEREASPQFDILATIGPARRQLGLRRLVGWMVRGVLGGGVVAILVLAAAHLFGQAGAIFPALAFLPAGALVGMVIGIRYWPDETQTARAVDGHFELRDRLTTALELRTSDRPLAALQRADTGRRLQGLALHESARGQINGRETGVAAIALIAALALALVGFPVARGHVPVASADQGRIHHVAQRSVPQIVRAVNHGLPPGARRDASIRKLNLALQHLRFQLQHASTRAKALRAISATQQQLHRIAQSLHPIKPASVSQLNRALAHQMTAQQRTQAAGNNRQSLAAAAATLNRLARALSHMSASQRAALARSLAKAANATSDSTLRAALHQAASSLAYNDPASAASALQAAANALSQSPDAQMAQSRINAASAQLDGSKSAVSGLSSPGTGNTPSSGSTGTGQGKGTGTGKGSGKGTGNGSGKGSGQGQGAGAGQGQGRGTGNSGSNGNRGSTGSGRGSGGSGGTGGHGIGGGRGGAGNHGAGHSGARVYVPPTRVGKGAHTIQNGGPNGAPLPGSTVPYRQVIGQYEQTAHSALDRASLPPAMQNYVRQYFSSISR